MNNIFFFFSTFFIFSTIFIFLIFFSFWLDSANFCVSLLPFSLHHNEIRAVFELSPDFKGYAKDRAICKQERLKEVLRIDKSNKKSKRQSPKYPNYTFEMYRPKKSLEDIDWKASENYLF